MKIEALSRDGIEFFDNALECIDNYEKKSWKMKLLSLIRSYNALFFYALNKKTPFLEKPDDNVQPLTNVDNRTLSKGRLVVCLHGLNNNPSHLKNILTEIQKKNLPDTDIFVPYILQNGNGRLDEMVKPIFAEIEKWAKTGGEKELVLIGISNGGRVARAIETEIGKSRLPIKKLRFVSIVGACRGSSLATLANKVGLSWFMSKNISEEMPTTSDRNRRLHQEWVDGVSKGGIEREYTFIASPHDWHVPNYDSSLMDVQGQKARYAIVPGYGHITILRGVAHIIAEIIS